MTGNLGAGRELTEDELNLVSGGDTKTKAPPKTPTTPKTDPTVYLQITLQDVTISS